MDVNQTDRILAVDRLFSDNLLRPDQKNETRTFDFSVTFSLYLNIPRPVPAIKKVK